MRPHLGQGGCQAIEDAAILAELIGGNADLTTAFRRFEEVRKPRVSALVRESAAIGRVLNLRPAALSALATRATVLAPEFLITRHLASVAAGSAFTLPDGIGSQP
jgi:2-polyprenyl-6-methoxyphenol hydroxylase-like FAD-dependent oxidoreductase